MEFVYVALREGSREKGRIEAADRTEALQILRERGLTPIELVPAKKWGSFRRGLSDEDLLLFTEHLRRLLEGGLPIDRALEFLEKLFSTTGKRALSTLTGRLRERLRRGKSLSEALGEEKVPSFYIHLIKTGELAGNLPEILSSLERYLQERRRFRSELISASIYPTFLLIFGLFAVQTVLVYVLPRFAYIFEEFGTKPPFLTWVLLKAGLFWKAWGPYCLIGLGAVLLAALRMLRHPDRRKRMEDLFLKIPLIGRLLLVADLARIFRATGVMLGGGLPLYKTFLQAAEISVLEELKRALREAAEDMRRGAPLHAALAGLPPEASFVLDFLSIGEESGTLVKSCEQIAELCEEQFSGTVQRLFKLLEPLTILVFGLFVGAVMISMLLAIFEIQP